MNIISHRGAAGLATENSKQSIDIGSKLGALYVEFDVQKTSDNIPIVIHNISTPMGFIISETSYHKIKQELPNILHLKDALAICQPSPALIEIKSNQNTAELILPYLIKYPKSAITTFYTGELEVIKSKSKVTTCYLMQRKHPIGLINKALHSKANGIGINKNWLILLPYIYLKAKKNDLSLFVYTVNSRFMARIINRFFPKILICTDNPNKLI